MARYITAAELGHDINNAVSFIDVAPSVPTSKSADGRMEMHSQAITMGPMLSKEMQDVIDSKFKSGEIQKSEINHKRLAEIFADRSLGVNLSTWLRARILISVLGPAAEGKFTGVEFNKVLNAYSSEIDLQCVVGDCMIAGILDPAAISDLINDAADRAEELLERQDIWDGILAVASSLPAAGRVEGRQIFALLDKQAGL